MCLFLMCCSDEGSCCISHSFHQIKCVTEEKPERIQEEIKANQDQDSKPDSKSRSGFILGVRRSWWMIREIPVDACRWEATQFGIGSTNYLLWARTDRLFFFSSDLLAHPLFPLSIPVQPSFETLKVSQESGVSPVSSLVQLVMSEVEGRSWTN